MRKAILALLAALPLSVMAAYVELNITPLDPPIGVGYYYMLIDNSAYERYDFAYLLASGDGNLNSVNRSAIVSEGAITSDSVSFTDAPGLDAGTTVYFAVFTPSSFGLETLYALSAAKELNNSETYFSVGSNDDLFKQPASTLSYTIPEPTSGLLVLVGASLLALKRRRA